jgi:hypothetical protein
VNATDTHPRLSDVAVVNVHLTSGVFFPLCYLQVPSSLPDTAQKAHLHTALTDACNKVRFPLGLVFRGGLRRTETPCHRTNTQPDLHACTTQIHTPTHPHTHTQNHQHTALPSKPHEPKANRTLSTSQPGPSTHRDTSPPPDHGEFICCPSSPTLVHCSLAYTSRRYSP